MSAKIIVLPDDVANHIAAGEVIERPASVVKELVENSLDADATHIDIEIGIGGKAYIRVNDNGHGMSRENACLAFERHATSKIVSTADLSLISTLGFRGEALPSIASVSKLKLLTRPSDSLVGTRIGSSSIRLHITVSRATGSVEKRSTPTWTGSPVRGPFPSIAIIPSRMCRCTLGLRAKFRATSIWEKEKALGWEK